MSLDYVGKFGPKDDTKDGWKYHGGNQDWNKTARNETDLEKKL